MLYICRLPQILGGTGLTLVLDYLSLFSFAFLSVIGPQSEVLGLWKLYLNIWISVSVLLHKCTIFNMMCHSSAVVIKCGCIGILRIVQWQQMYFHCSWLLPGVVKSLMKYGVMNEKILRSTAIDQWKVWIYFEFVSKFQLSGLLVENLVL